MPDAWNPKDLREFLLDHSGVGYEVTAPILGPGVIESQERTGGGFTFFRVMADNPMPFAEFADALDVPADQMNLAQWQEEHMYGSRAFPIMAVELRERLEDEGGTVSRQDVLFASLMMTGCLDLDQRVVCYSFDSRETPIRVLRKGLAVLVSDRETGLVGWPGRIVGFDKSEDDVQYALVEQFAPVPFMFGPESMFPKQIREGFYSSNVDVIGYGIIDAYEEQGLKIPRGKRSRDKKYLELTKTMKMSTFDKLCEKYYPDEPYCRWQAMTLFVLPVRLTGEKKAQLLPLPAGSDPDEFLMLDPPTGEGVLETMD